MENNVTPVKHGVFSSTGSVVAGTAGSAITVGSISSLLWIAGFVTAGVMTGGLGGLALGAFGVLGFPIGGVIGTAAGGLFGAGNSIERVKAESAAAEMMQNQVDIAKAQIYARGAVPSNDASVGFPPQGSAMNPAFSSVGGVQNEGRVSGQQLAAARG